MSSIEAASEAKPMAEKPVKEKKARAPKAAAPKEKKQQQQPKSSSKPSAPSHPPYFQMIKEAIHALNERTGSSPYAIAKHMEEEHKGVLPANFRKMLAVQLRNFAAKGKLVKVKASFKLSDLGKKEEKTKKNAPVVEKKEMPKVKVAAGTKRKAAANGNADSKKKAVVKTTKRATPVKAKRKTTARVDADSKKRKTTSKGSEMKMKKPVVKRATPVKAKAKSKKLESIKPPVKRAKKATA